MTRIKQKLFSRRGSSMILALVFLLFCTFVGGSVLAIATANSARIKHLTAEEQQFLNQRSAVRVMQDALTKSYRPAAGADPITPPQVRLTVHVVTTTTQVVELLDGGGREPVGDPVKTIQFAFSAVESDTKPAIQRLVYESAIRRVLDMYDYNATLDTVALENLEFLPLTGSDTVTLDDLGDLWLTTSDGSQLQITLTDTSNVVPDDSVTAQVICQGGDDPYHFWVTFGENGQDAQVSLRMLAMISQRPGQQGAPRYENEREENGATLADMKTDSTVTITITWESPAIVKGGID